MYFLERKSSVVSSPVFDADFEVKILFYYLRIELFTAIFFHLPLLPAHASGPGDCASSELGACGGDAVETTDGGCPAKAAANLVRPCATHG